MRKNRIQKKCSICSKEFTVKLSESNRGVGKFCSRKCSSQSQTKNSLKDKNPNWRGGSIKYKKREVKIRDNYTCQICGLMDLEIMEVDHIKPRKTNPELGLDINNLITLCPNCHTRKTLREYKIKKHDK